MRDGLKWVLILSLSASLPMVAWGRQDSGNRPQTRPAPAAGRPQTGGGQRPGGGGAQPGRPQPQRPRPQPQPPRPQPQPPRPQPQPPRPQPQPPRPQPGRPQPVGGRPPLRPGGGRPPQWGRPPQNRPRYQFRPRDRDFLRRHYLRHLAYINLARRPVFSIGGYFPYADIGYMTPVPAEVYRYMPAPPPGYQMGYFDGYVVVYDPLTYFLANVVDLLQQ